jgi:hypothetical protein
MGKYVEVELIYFNILSWHLLTVTKKKHVRHQSGQPGFGQKINLGPPEYEC